MELIKFLQTPYWARRLSHMSYNNRMAIESAIIMQTPFLSPSVTIKQRGWHILHAVTDIPVCKMCNNTCTFQKSNTYTTYCSVKCSRKSPEVNKKKLSTEIDNAGGVDEFVTKKREMFKKISNTLYGVDNISQAEQVKVKIRNNRNNQ